MTLNDLRDGDVVELRDGKTYIVRLVRSSKRHNTVDVHICDANNTLAGILTNSHSTTLECIGNIHRDVVKVWMTDSRSQFPAIDHVNLSSCVKPTLTWSRHEARTKQQQMLGVITCADDIESGDIVVIRNPGGVQIAHLAMYDTDRMYLSSLVDYTGMTMDRFDTADLASYSSGYRIDIVARPRYSVFMIGLFIHRDDPSDFESLNEWVIWDRKTIDAINRGEM